VRHLRVNDAELQKLAKLLQDWDGELSRESAAGALYAAWHAELTKAFYHPRLPKELHPHVRYLGGTKVLLHALENPEDYFGKGPRDARDELLRTTFARAAETVKKKLGNDPSKWSWGKLHTVTFRHPLGRLHPSYAKALNVGPVGRGGDALTVNNTRYNDQFEQVHGATYRHVLDLADWDKGLATSAPGQSGQPGSPHYDDLLPLWARGRYFPLAFSRKKVEEVTRHSLRLTPR
jgi:penicillin amidase